MCETRPLIRKCMPEVNLINQNRNSGPFKNFPFLGDKFKKSFFPHFTKLYNNLPSDLLKQHDITIFKDKLKIQFKPKKYRHFNLGSKYGNAIHTQLRVGRSLLNAHGFEINLTDSDQCLCSRSETVSHYLTDCFLYTEERRSLYDSMEQLIPKFKKLPNKSKLFILLNGINLDCDEFDSRNPKIVYIVQKFISQTKRF